MTHIYALQGTEDSNYKKKGILEDLHKMLIELYPDSTFKPKEGNGIISAVGQLKNGLKIAIEGDDTHKDWLKDRLYELKKAKCDVIFCSCYTKRESVDVVESMEDSTCKVHFIGLRKPNRPFLKDSEKQPYYEQAHELRIMARI